VTEAAVPSARAQGVGERIWAAVAGAWGFVAGLLPHVLHHVGPLAGAAVLAGAGGSVLFFAVGLLLSVPLLVRLYRRFKTPAAPAIAIAVFTAMFAVSSFVIAPRINGGSDNPVPSKPGIQQPSGHESHHTGDAK